MTIAKKLYMKTYGCQMNVYDSERIVESLAQVGYQQTETPTDADLILLNTCHIREKAAEKIYSELGRFRELKGLKDNLKIGVSGCVAQAEGAEIIDRQPLVDLVVGPQSYHRLPEMLASLEAGKRVIDTDFPDDDKFNHLPHRKMAKRAPAAFLTIQEGCDKFCAFCVVPYTRGAESSRGPERVLGEARALVEQGVREITLLGQNVNAYCADDGRGGSVTLAGLIWRLAELEGLARIRFTTSHPNDMRDDLLDAFTNCEKLMPYLHLPVQSGSDRILKAMNRRHTAESYIKLIEKIRIARPDILISGDFIVGFPGECEEDFQATLDLVDAVNYGQAYSFKYSPRPGTPAAECADVDDEVKSERLQRLQALLNVQQSANLRAMVGKTLPVLFEKDGRKAGQLVGRSQYLQTVCVDAPIDKIGQICSVKVEDAGRNTLLGRLSSETDHFSEGDKISPVSSSDFETVIG